MCELEEVCDLHDMLPAGWRGAEEDVPHMDGDSGVALLKGLVGLEGTLEDFSRDCPGLQDGHCPLFKILGVDTAPLDARQS